VFAVIRKRMRFAGTECVLITGGDTFLGDKPHCVQMSHDLSTLPGTYYALRLEQRRERQQHVVRWPVRTEIDTRSFGSRVPLQVSLFSAVLMRMWWDKDICFTVRWRGEVQITAGSPRVWWMVNWYPNSGAHKFSPPKIWDQPQNSKRQIGFMNRDPYRESTNTKIVQNFVTRDLCAPTLTELI
jgi:hypothetical protein